MVGLTMSLRTQILSPYFLWVDFSPMPANSCSLDTVIGPDGRSAIKAVGSSRGHAIVDLQKWGEENEVKKGQRQVKKRWKKKIRNLENGT